MNYRPISADDLEECADVLYAADDELMIRHGLPPSPHNRVALLRLFSHILESSPHRAWLAHDGRRIVGFGAAMQYEQVTFLAFLFVLPGLQSKGTGRALLERAMAGSQRRAVCILSIQPVSAGLYARYGMVPRVPIYILTAERTPELPPLPAGMRIERLALKDATELDREVVGITRPADHAWWETLDRVRYGLYEGPSLVGYGYVQSVGRLGPFVVRREEQLVPLIGRLMHEVPPVDAWMINVPGPARNTFVALLKAGFRLEGPPIIYCATESKIDHSRYLPATFALP